MTLLLLILPLSLLAVGDLAFTADYELADDLPPEGCQAAHGPGKLLVDCRLPSGSATVTVKKAATSLTVSYEMKTGPLVCKEIEQAEPYIRNYTNVGGKNVARMQYYTVKDVELANESLACPLLMLDTNKTESLTLNSVQGVLQPLHFEGIEGVKLLSIINIDPNVTSVPYEAMATFESLERVTLTGGSFVLKEEASVLPHVTFLEISRGRLRALPRRAFANTPSLRMLLLFANRIEHLHADAFEGLPELRNLSLNSNALRVLPAGALGRSPRLQRLDLYDNPLAELSPGAFASLRRLETVLLFGNRGRLTLRAGTFADLPSLRELKLYRNSLETLPGDLLFNSTELSVLDLRDNELKELPETLFRGLRLQEVYLCNNKLVELKENLLQGLDTLRVLCISKNTLRVLPATVFQDLVALRKLDLSDNEIEALDRGIFTKLTQLEKLLLAKNRIGDIMNLFDGLTKLEELSLAENDLVISRERNTVAMSDTPAVYDGEGTPLVYSPFQQLQQLRTLQLAHNRVRLLCDDWRQLYHLQLLNLSHNEITSVSAYDSYFPTSTEIDLSFNRIETFVPQIYYDQQALPSFDLSHNPFRCSCSLYPFLVRLAARNLTLPRLRLEHAACAAPPPLAATPLARLAPDALTCAAPCPAPCHSCLRRPHLRRVELACDAPPASWPPLPDSYRTYALALTSPSASPLRLDELPSTVRLVNMSGLRLTSPPAIGPSAVAGGLTVDLRNNSLTSVPVRLLRANVSLLLADNPLRCSCAEREGVAAAFAGNASLADWRLVRCEDRRLLRELEPAQLCYERELLVGAVLAVAAAALALAAAWVLARHWALVRVVLDKAGVWRLRRARRHLHDVFLSFASADGAFAEERLAGALEARALRLCLASRDWRVGDAIAAQVERSVRDAAVVLALVSRAYVASDWCRLELRLAAARGNLLVVLLDDLDPSGADLDRVPELKAYVRSNTYIKQSHPLLLSKIVEAVLLRQKVDERAEEREKPVGIDTQLDSNGMIVNNALTPPLA